MEGYMAFWVAIAVLIFSTTLIKALYAQRAFEAKHETLRRLLANGQTVDPELVKELLKTEQQMQQPLRPSSPGMHYKLLRVIGTLSLCISAAFFMSVTAVMLISPAGFMNHGPNVGVYMSIGISFILLMAGVGFHFCTRYVTPPPAKQNSNQE